MTEKYGVFKEPSYLAPGQSTAGHRPAPGGASVLHTSCPKTGCSAYMLVIAMREGKQGHPPVLDWQGADATFSPLQPLGSGKPLPNTQCVTNASNSVALRALTVRKQ